MRTPFNALVSRKKPPFFMPLYTLFFTLQVYAHHAVTYIAAPPFNVGD
jgi:hypothetical protein